MLEEIRNSGLWVKGWSLSLFFIIMFFVNFLNVSGAADYPSRPIQMIVPNPPGGGGDTVARIINNKISDLLGQPVVVLNKAGGGGALGAYAAKAAPPDGYTIFVLSPSHLALPYTTKGITFNIFKDFTPINLTVTSPTVIVVKKDAPWLTLEELISEVKKNPGKLTNSLSSYGGTGYFASELFKMITGTDITQIPMDGTGPSISAVMGGHLNVSFPEYGVAHRFLQAGSLKALAVMAKTRLKDLPEVPTTVEKGFPKLVTSTYQAFMVRLDTPRGILEKLEKIFKEALKDKEIIEKFENTGWIVENLASEETKEFLAKDLETKLEVVKVTKMVPK